MVKSEKILSLLLALIMAVSLLMIPVSAADADAPVTLEAAYADGNVTVTLKAAEAFEIASLGGQLTWPSALGTAAASASSDNFTVSKDTGNVGYVNTSGENLSVAAGDTLAAFTFSKELEDGDYEFQFKLNAASYVENKARVAYDWAKETVTGALTVASAKTPLAIEAAYSGGTATVTLKASAAFEIAALGGRLTWPAALGTAAASASSTIENFTASKDSGNVGYVNISGENLSVKAGDTLATFTFTQELAAGSYTFTLQLNAASYVENKARTAYDWAAETVTGTLTVSGGGGGNGSSGSTGGGAASNLTVNSARNGKVTASPQNPASGATVTLTVTPDEGYELDTLTVKDAAGKELALTKTGANTYTFTMPGGKAAVTASFKAKSGETVKNPFTDVKESDYAYDAILWAYGNDIVYGKTETLFAPKDPCTRAEMVAFLWRAAGRPEPAGTGEKFNDVDYSAYYAKAMEWAVENGIAYGYGDGRFGPDDTVTRAQSVSFLFRLAKAAAVNGARFNDVSADAYYAAAVTWAADNGVTAGYGDGRFGPDDSCLREQIVSFLYRYYAE